MRRGVDYAALAGIRRGGTSDSDDSANNDDRPASWVPPARPAQQNARDTPLAKALTGLGLARSGGINDLKRVRSTCEGGWFACNNSSGSFEPAIRSLTHTYEFQHGSWSEQHPQGQPICLLNGRT